MIARIVSNNNMRVAILLAMLVWLAFPFFAQGTLQLGNGWLSSKLFERSGSADSQIVFDRGQDTFIVVASAPTMTTQAATGATVVGILGQATLHGTVVDMNGMPSVDVGFRWGYAPTSLIYLTATTNVTTTGAYSRVLTGFDPFTIVYYQAIGTSDGVGYGDSTTFASVRAVQGMTGLEMVLLISPVIVWIALLAAFGVFAYRGYKRKAISGGIDITIGLIALLLAILIFPLLISAINTIRLLP